LEQAYITKRKNSPDLAPAMDKSEFFEEKLEYNQVYKMASPKGIRTLIRQILYQHQRLPKAAKNKVNQTIRHF
jgi:hypothetical protein